ncbi:DUF3068 domain-containing protein [Tomitella biformata]|uniref:DUF3068 domain-containing protein n=1 Tax=Tomitella biformata TaxID=630403 RepID=UPI0004649AB1|nr:DUF3068 domain-containing protein [Tomitella biformata]
MAQGKGGTGKIVGAILVGVGMFLLVVAILLPTYSKGKAMKTPVDLEVTTVAVGTASILDSASLLAGTPRIDTNVPIEAVRHVVTADPTNQTIITVQAGQRLLRLDKPEPAEGAKVDPRLLTGSIDRVTLDRISSEPVADHPGSLATEPNMTGSGDTEFVELPREGLQYKFPFNVDKDTQYQYFDLTARTTLPIDYVGDEEISGLKVYHYTQEVGPIDLSVVAPSASNKLTVPAAALGIQAEAPAPAPEAPAEGAAADGAPAAEAAEPEVEVRRFYTNTRDLYVDPLTGVIVKGVEQIDQYFAQTADAPERIIALSVSPETGLGFDQETIDYQVKQAKDGADKIDLLTKTLPLIMGIVGLLMILGGLFVGLRGGRGAGARAADGGNSHSADTQVIPRQ